MMTLFGLNRMNLSAVNSLCAFLTEDVAASKHPVVFFIWNLLREGAEQHHHRNNWIKNYTEKSIFKEIESITQKEQIKAYLLCCLQSVLNVLLNVCCKWVICVPQGLWEGANHYIWQMEYTTSWWFPRYCFKWKNEQFNIYQRLFIPFQHGWARVLQWREDFWISFLTGGCCREILHTGAQK